MFALLLVPTAGCNDSQSKQCTAVCQRETDCAEEQSNKGEPHPYDFDECVAACVSLEADKASVERVQKHMQCVENASDCQTLLNCRI